MGACCDPSDKLNFDITNIAQQDCDADVLCVPTTNGMPQDNPPSPKNELIRYDPCSNEWWLFTCDGGWQKVEFSLCALEALDTGVINDICNALNIPAFYDSNGCCVQGSLTLQDLAQQIFDCLDLGACPPTADPVVIGDGKEIFYCGPGGTAVKGPTVPSAPVCPPSLGSLCPNDGNEIFYCDPVSGTPVKGPLNLGSGCGLAFDPQTTFFELPFVTGFQTDQYIDGPIGSGVIPNNSPCPMRIVFFVYVNSELRTAQALINSIRFRSSINIDGAGLVPWTTDNEISISHNDLANPGIQRGQWGTNSTMICGPVIAAGGSITVEGNVSILLKDPFNESPVGGALVFGNGIMSVRYIALPA